MDFFKPKIETSPNIRTMINIGAGFDIPTGFYVCGKYGESLLNGGLGAITSVVAIGNNFKTTILHYMCLAASSRLVETSNTNITSYDTEVSMHEQRCLTLSQRFPQYANRDIINEGVWLLTDSSIYAANKWWDATKEYCDEKLKAGSKLEQVTPFLERDGKTNMKCLPITFSELDSFSEFTTDDVLKMQDDNELGDSGANTMHMRQGLAKTRFLMELPTVVNKAYHFMLMTAQIGKQIEMASGPMAPPPAKKLQFLKNGDTIKNATGKFTFINSNCWHSFNAAPLINQSTKAPEYPRDSKDNAASGDTDLMLISLRNLRSKSGPTGYVLELVVSQSEGVLPTLTEFHYIKESNRYGLSGSLQNYALDLLPEINLSRTTVRGKIENNPLLCRALNITSEMCQMNQFWRLDENLLCTPKQLYDDLKAKGFDWNMLLNTRGWWTFDNDKHPVPYLSTKDLLRIRTGEYFPFWLEEDKKTMKKGFHGN